MSAKIQRYKDNPKYETGIPRINPYIDACTLVQSPILPHDNSADALK
jgi:hypothetical protein